MDMVHLDHLSHLIPTLHTLLGLTFRLVQEQ